jgi:hypothetical protein
VGGRQGTGGGGASPDAAQACVENGHSYAVGETFKSDCNTCTCTGSGAMCTLMACVGPSDAATDPLGTPDALGCVYGGKTYALGASFSLDCNTCTCTPSGVACTGKACGVDARSDVPPVSDAGCSLSANLTFGHDGGMVIYRDVNRLTASAFTITRNYSGRANPDGGDTASCSPKLPTCGSSTGVTVATINADLADPDVQALWSLPLTPVPLFGTDPRPMDGTVYSIELDDGHKVLVGGQCASPTMSSCRYIPAGLVRLTQDLQSLATAMMADSACKGL